MRDGFPTKGPDSKRSGPFLFAGMPACRLRRRSSRAEPEIHAPMQRACKAARHGEPLGGRAVGYSYSGTAVSLAKARRFHPKPDRQHIRPISTAYVSCLARVPGLHWFTGLPTATGLFSRLRLSAPDWVQAPAGVCDVQELFRTSIGLWNLIASVSSYAHCAPASGSRSPGWQPRPGFPPRCSPSWKRTG